MKRSKFSLSYHKLLTCEMGDMVPIGLTEVLPGDSMQQATSLLIRVSPQLAPIMHPVHARIHHWFVPHRLVWDDWEDFITGGPDGNDDSVFPTVSLPYGVNKGTLSDYFGVPPGFGGLSVSALPYRGYALIFNEWYRDQDLQLPVAISKASGVGATTGTSLVQCSWEKDYFTSARPWPQKGDGVTISIGDTAPVKSTGAAVKFGNVSGAGTAGDVSTDGSGNMQFQGVPAGSFVLEARDPTGYYADLSAATSISINDLREAFALQRFQEARARFGSRYTEYLRYLGVRSSDARLQRPEYLGGGKQTIQFSEVLQTGVTTDGDDQEGVGNLKGHGIGAMRSNRYRRFFEEHGYVISILSVRPKTIYAQGIPRHLSRRIKEDFFQKELQHIGQQEILKKEIYAGVADLNATWGYQDRYDEYRRCESGIAGDFRDTLDFWHYARLFAAAPTLNADFVECNPTKRVYAEQTTHPLWIMAHHSIQARRLVARSGSSFIY